MMKRMAALLLILALIFALAGCGGKEETPDAPAADTPAQTQQPATPENEAGGKSELCLDMTQELIFMGYSIMYPSDASEADSHRGTLIGDRVNNYCVIVEAPGAVGDMTKLDNLEDVPDFCRPYLIKSLEEQIRGLFDWEQTTQEIRSSTEITHNGVAMLREDGTFTNTKLGTTYEYVALYLLGSKNRDVPLYIVGIPMVNGCDVTELMDTMAENITSKTN